MRLMSRSYCVDAARLSEQPASSQPRLLNSWDALGGGDMAFMCLLILALRCETCLMR